MPIYIHTRPFAKQFLLELSYFYEIFIFTASISEYANKAIDLVDPLRVCAYRLYRENCTYQNGMYIKDLSLLNRDLKNIIIVDVFLLLKELAQLFLVPSGKRAASEQLLL